MNWVFGRKPKVFIDLETNPNTKLSGTYREYNELLRKKSEYL